MTHFGLMVLIPGNTDINDSDAVEMAINERLAEYDENKEVPEYDRICYCIGRAAKEAAHTYASQINGTIDDLRIAHRKAVEERGWTSPEQLTEFTSETQKEAFFDELDAYNQKLQALWNEMLKPWEATEHAYFETHPLKDAPDPTCQSCFGKGNYKSRYNPDTFAWRDGNGTVVATTWANQAVSGLWYPQRSKPGFLPHQEPPTSIPFLVLQGMPSRDQSQENTATEKERHLSRQIRNLVQRLPDDAFGSERSVRDLRIAADDEYTWSIGGGSLPPNWESTGLTLFRMQLVTRSRERFERVITSDGRLLRSTFIGGSRWDWWTINGRWKGWDGADQYIVKVTELPADWDVWAIVTEDGEWHENGQMGYWAMSINKKEPQDWDSERYEVVSGYTNCYAVLIDAHI